MSSLVHAITAKKPDPSGNITGKKERDSYAIAVVDSLLKKTGQWQKWKQIRQTNDALARKLAPLVVERNALMNQSAAGEKINWDTFDTLTKKLIREGIHLWDKKALLASGWQSGRKPNGSVSSGDHSMHPVNRQRSQKPYPGGEFNTLPPPAISSAFVLKYKELNLTENNIDKTGTASSNMETGGQRDLQSPEKPENTELKLTEPSVVAGSIGPDTNPPPSGEIDLLILDARWGRYILASGIGAYGNPDQLFMPLGVLAAILEVPLHMDSKAGSAEGDVQGKAFDLDLNQNTLILGNKSIKLQEKDFLVDEDDIYVNTEVLKDWLPLNFDFSFRNMTVGFNTRETLPFEERIERQQRWGKLSASTINFGPSELEEKTKPSFIGMPVGDLSVSASHNSRSQDPNKVRYTFSSAGNLIGATGHFYATGDDQQKLNRLQARLEKTDIDGNLFGGATRIAAGDIRTLGKGGTEQGVFLDTRPLSRGRDFDTTRFEGNLELGWEVELYRGSILLDVFKVAEDGLYVFEDVDLYYGNNPLRLVFYGPEGQKREEDKSFEVGRDMLPKNSLHYAASITRQDTTTYTFNPSKTEDRGNIRAVGLMEYGLGPKTFLFGGLTTETDDGERRYRLNAGLGQTLNRASLRFEGIQDIGDGGNSMGASLQTTLGDTRLKVGHTFENRLDTDQIINTSEASISGNLGNKEKIDFPYSFSAQYTDREGSHASRFRLLNSLKTWPFYWNHTIDHNYESSRENPETIDGRISALAAIKGISLRAYGNYTFDDKDNGFTDTGISVSRMLMPGIIAQTGLNASLTDEDRIRMNAQLNWRYKNFTISPKISGSNDGSWDTSINIKLNTSFGLEPHRKVPRTIPQHASHHGHTSVRVFEDKNMNGIFDDNEKSLEDIKVKSVQSGRSALTDEHGIAMLSLPSHLKTDIVIDERSIEDPALFPARPGEAVTTKPGDIRALTFPVIRTGEIDGTLYGINAAGESVILKQVEVLLKNEEGEVVDRELSEFDGFYLFEKVPPGNYTVEAAWTWGNGQEIRKSMDANVDDTGSIASGIDMVITYKEEEMPVVVSKIHPEPEVVPTQPMKKKESTSFDMPAQGKPMYGLHLTSYRTPEKAITGIQYLLNKYKGLLKQSDFTIKKVDVSEEKGTWYRVMAGNFSNQEIAAKLGRRIKMSSSYCKVVTLNSEIKDQEITGVHLTSFRTRAKALLSIEELKNQYPVLLKNIDFTIKDVNLGPKMGKWKRVVAGNFSTSSDAKIFAKRIKMKLAYCKTMTIAKDTDLGLHLASYKTPETASKGLKFIQKQYGNLIQSDKFSIRRVDMGPAKGIWYRIFTGNFEDKQAAVSLKNSLNQMKQYAEIRPLNNI